MHDAVISELPADIFVGVAAVGDFRPLAPLNLSLLEGEAYTLQLRQNPDILQAVGTHKSLRPQVVVGFAAETNDLLTYARSKLERKGADLICANQVGDTMAKRRSSMNVVTFVTRDGHEEMPELSKLQVGEAIGRWVGQMFAGTHNS
jgi:phosphopantothenoylcysteine decarboxylase/phosphopantothenate--cysteine ligase